MVERVTMAKGGMPPRNKKNFRATKKGAKGAPKASDFARAKQTVRKK